MKKAKKAPVRKKKENRKPKTEKTKPPKKQKSYLERISLIPGLDRPLIYPGK
jgi:hypothetical protein